jgi:hypothetical protein
MKHNYVLIHLLVIPVFVLAPLRSRAQQLVLQIPPSTPLPIQLGKHVPMKKGEPLKGYLLYPVFAENRLVIPAGTTLLGNVVKLNPDRSRRIHSLLRGDFTPFHIPVVQFNQLVLPDGSVQSIVSQNATDGAPALHLSAAPAAPQRSFFTQQLNRAKQQVKDTVAVVTAPGRGDRLVQAIYRQLPYHPERIESATAWTVSLEQPLSLRLDSFAAKLSAGPAKGFLSPRVDTPVLHERSWQLHAYLEETISSAKKKPGDTFTAVVAEPVFDASQNLEIPQGSQLTGTVTLAKPARWFGRSGKLRFNFRELKLRGGLSQHVDGTLTGADASRSADLQLDAEGAVQSKSRNGAAIPLALTFLAGRALDDDGSLAGNSAVASNGFGIVGRVVGIVASSRNFAAGIGFYAAALSLYDQWVARGHDVVFRKDTRIEVTTSLGRNLFHAAEVQQPPAIDR